jgi:hypothetical protein
MLDPNPDPGAMNADPQPCLKLLLLLWWWLSLELFLGRGLTPMALVTRHRHQHCRQKNPVKVYNLKRLVKKLWQEIEVLPGDGWLS